MAHAGLAHFWLALVVWWGFLSHGVIAIESLPGERCSIFAPAYKSCDASALRDFAPPAKIVAATIPERGTKSSGVPDLEVLVDVLNSIGVMQTDYFAPWLGTWPDSIDWTGAVMGTHVSGTLSTLSEAFPLLNSSTAGGVEDWKLKENIVEGYFSHIIAYYFGENHFAIRNEAYDDILWVVLGWLEAVKFIRKHTDLHYELKAQGSSHLGTSKVLDSIADILSNQTWHGNEWIAGFAHRSRVFWELGSKGWDTVYCGGGMIWSPHLLPYKNAITNELWIAGSISMYLHFPGDENPSPYYEKQSVLGAARFSSGQLPARSRNTKFLQAAVDGYNWLVGSGMMDDRGLYTDGFHISGILDPENNNTKCDERDGMVFTYNQGVILTGQRGLWEATGSPSYLRDGHRLIQSVINATGYDLKRGKPIDDPSQTRPHTLPPWHGLGRAGILEDPCDASGSCSQDGQTFKGIYFHHLAYFCAPLTTPVTPEEPEGTQLDKQAFQTVKEAHDEACASYGGWLKHNADAALGTRDADGKFGQWWTASLLTDYAGPWPTLETDGIDHASADNVDYRNYGVPNDTTWRRPGDLALMPGPPRLPVDVPTIADSGAEGGQKPLNPAERRSVTEKRGPGHEKDPNDRDRGRTVETQGGGLALMRAYWSIVHAPR
ncbi:glycoside hydrolase family 76 protein [Apiospora arundinis]|uniref:Glycoside hydrolase family 76 protein n=1 Tax=Apiospora arundinis TaxID=335852 RepID=A0ABR2HQX6_9PEZI